MSPLLSAFHIVPTPTAMKWNVFCSLQRSSDLFTHCYHLICHRCDPKHKLKVYARPQTVLPLILNWNKSWENLTYELCQISYELVWNEYAPHSHHNSCFHNFYDSGTLHVLCCLFGDIKENIDPLYHHCCVKSDRRLTQRVLCPRVLSDIWQDIIRLLWP